MDDMTPIDIHAPTVEEAISKGLLQLGLTRNDVIVEIVDEGSQGILGVGARSAHIRLTPLRTPKPRRKAPPQPTPEPQEEPQTQAPPATEPEPQPPQQEQPSHTPAQREPKPSRIFEDEPAGVIDEEAMLAREAIAAMLGHMSIDASIEIDPANVDDPDAPWILDVRGQDLGALIGKKGETLDALQYITRLIVSRELQRRVDVIVDVEGYKERRAESLRKLATRMARQATKMGRTVTLEPMPPNERRIIHMTLRSNAEVTTESVGQGNRRRVTIIPT